MNDDIEKDESEKRSSEDATANNNAAEDPSARAADAEAQSESEQAANATALESEIAELKDRLLRALAETENVRRRAQREREDVQKYAVSGFAKDLLSVADNLRRALDSLPQTEIRDERVRKLLDGVLATERELLGIFERHGIRRIDPKGEAFDHNFHQAIFEMPTKDHPPGMIVEVLQPGYVIRDRLLRPAMVGVAKAMPDGPENPK